MAWEEATLRLQHLTQGYSNLITCRGIPAPRKWLAGILSCDSLIADLVGKQHTCAATGQQCCIAQDIMFGKSNYVIPRVHDDKAADNNNDVIMYSCQDNCSSTTRHQLSRALLASFISFQILRQPAIFSNCCSKGTLV